jgi:putative ABC transport system permease protein
LVAGESASFFTPGGLFTNNIARLVFQAGVSYTVFVISMSLMAPLLIGLMAKAIEPLLKSTFAALGALATRSIVSNMRRFALTGTMFVLSVMMAVFLASAWSSATFMGGRIASSMFGGMDLVVSTSPDFDKRGGKTLQGSLSDSIARLPGVTHVSSIRITDFSHGRYQSSLIAVDPVPERPGFNLTSGNERQAISAFVSGQGIVMDEGFASAYALRTGDLLSFATPSGTLRLPILGTAEVMPGMAGATVRVYISRDLYRRYWRDDDVTAIGVSLAAGISKEGIMDEISSRFGENSQVFVLSVSDFRNAVERTLQRELAPLIPIFTFATVIALFGLVNSLLASVLDRTREIGTLRSLGTTRAQIGKLMLYEAAALGIMGTVLAIPTGVFMNYLNYLQNRFFTAVYFPFKPASPLFLAVLLIVTTLLAALGGYMPGRQAARIRITEAMQTE